jgi:hypothetical protein
MGAKFSLKFTSGRFPPRQKAFHEHKISFMKRARPATRQTREKLSIGRGAWQNHSTGDEGISNLLKWLESAEDTRRQRKQRKAFDEGYNRGRIFCEFGKRGRIHGDRIICDSG